MRPARALGVMSAPSPPATMSDAASPDSSVAMAVTVWRAASLPVKPKPSGRKTPLSDSIISTCRASSARC